MRIPQWFVLVWVVVIGIVAVGAAAFSYTFVRDRATELSDVIELPAPPQLFENNNSEPEQASASPTPQEDLAGPEATESASESNPDATAEPAAGAQSELPAADQIAAWDDPRRVTILLLGIDQRAGESGSFPTDTMILVSLDPVGKTAAILSIPRDLWVEIPGISQPGRINTANILGDEINYPGGGGPMLASKTVERTLGVRVDYFMLINFEVFMTLVDAVGPVEVCPPEPIDDDRYPDGSYGYITIHFDAGCQELDAEKLLQYARTRHGNSDISRSSRQQEVILALRKKVLSAGGVTALIPKAPDLWSSMQANIRTNITLEDLIRLGLKAEEISSENIRQGQITFEEVLTGTGPDGEEILTPIPTDIRLLMQDLFRPAGTASARQ